MGGRDVCLCVRMDNLSAQRAYTRADMEVVEKKVFLWILKWNIPYYKL